LLRDAAEEQGDRDLLPPARDRDVRARALPAPGPCAVLVPPAAHGEARSRGAPLARSMAIHVGVIGEGVCSRRTARAAERVGALGSCGHLQPNARRLPVIRVRTPEDAVRLALRAARTCAGRKTRTWLS